MHKLVSIIIPAYNVDKYIDSCIRSVVGQTYEHLEIIIVNDGSTDNTGNIIKEWQSKDSRILVINQSNGGMSKARNSGLQVATGDYISFVDSDDIICSTMIDELVKNLENTKSDISVCSFKKIYNELFILPENKNDCEIFDREQCLSLVINDKLLGQMVWNKLYISKYVKNIKFLDGKYHEDIFWTYEALGAVNKICYTSMVLYGYRQRPGSVMNSPYSYNRLDAVEAVKSRYMFVKEKFPKLKISALQSFLFTCLYHYQMISRLNLKDGEELKKQIVDTIDSFDDLKIYYNDIFKNLEIKQKVWLKSFLHFPKLTSNIRNWLKIGI